MLTTWGKRTIGVLSQSNPPCTRGVPEHPTLPPILRSLALLRFALSDIARCNSNKTQFWLLWTWALFQLLALLSWQHCGSEVRFMRAVAAGASPCHFFWPTWRFPSFVLPLRPPWDSAFMMPQRLSVDLAFVMPQRLSVDLAFRFDSIASVFHAFCWFSFSLSILVRFFCVAAARLRAAAAGASPVLWALWPLLPLLWAR